MSEISRNTTQAVNALILLLIWADEKYNTQKNPCVVFATQKNLGVFHRPKKIPLGQDVRPKKILRTPPSLKYVSGAPGPSVHPYSKFSCSSPSPHPICSWNFEKLLDTYTYNFVCGVRGGVGPVWRWNGPETHIYCQILCIVLHTLQTLKEVWVFLFLQSS